MEFPTYQRDLSPDQRRVVLEESMQRELAAFALEIAEDGGKLTEGVREEFRLHYVRTCQAAWQDERITELETQLAGAIKKIALLSRRLDEVTDDA